MYPKLTPKGEEGNTVVFVGVELLVLGGFVLFVLLLLLLLLPDGFDGLMGGFERFVIEIKLKVKAFPLLN